VSLNLKNPRTHELARQLAELTGESLTTAVTLALEERLRLEQQRRGRATTAERILEFGRRFSAGMPPGANSAQHAELYGPDGLPQ
jgi:antitoxin VapB